MAATLYVLIRWPDGSRVIRIENIKEPRKPFHMYAVGEQVLARCPGFTGLYWGILKGISEHKCVLEEKLREDKEFQELLEDQGSVPSPAPNKRSRKFFPKWNRGNGLRKPQKDKAFKGITEEVEETCLHHSPATSAGLKGSHPFCVTKPSPSGTRFPPSSSHFQVPSPFQTVSAPGTSPRTSTRPSQGSKDNATIATRGKSDSFVTQCQKRLFVNSCDVSEGTGSWEPGGLEAVRRTFEMEREEKMEQLEQMVLGLHQEVLFLRRKVQRLEAASSKEPDPACQPCEAPEHFNGYTKEQLREAIRFDQKISTACKTLLYKLFTSDYIQSHSITGRRGNTFREAKPMMDERCIKVIRVLLKQKFGDHLGDTVITEKIQNVQKALRQKYKMECL